MRKTALLILLSFVLSCGSHENPDIYSDEISALQTEKDIKAYWQTLYDLDQITYLKETKGHLQGDSISISNMIRTALMFEIHGPEVYTTDNVVPILNLAHNYYDQSSLAFWPIIQACKKRGGIIESFGGKFPAYPLEALSLTFYDFSLFQQDDRYDGLLAKLNNKTYDNVSTALFELQDEQRRLSQLEVKDVIGKWHIERMKNIDEKGFFEIVKMSDNHLYLKRKHRLQKLVSMKSNDQAKHYKIENEPFGWTYSLNQGDLRLIDDQGITLIDYNIYK